MSLRKSSGEGENYIKLKHSYNSFLTSFLLTTVIIPSSMSYSRTERSLNLLQVDPLEIDRIELLKDAYENSVVLEMLERQQARGIPRTGIITDIEGSWWYDGQDEESIYLEQVFRNHDIPVAAITGFSFEQAFELINTGSLPWYVGMGNASGNGLFVLQRDGTYKRDEYYHETVVREVEWDRLQVLLQARKMVSRFSQYATRSSAPEFCLDWQNKLKEDVYLRLNGIEADPEVDSEYEFQESAFLSEMLQEDSDYGGALEAAQIDTDRLCFYFYANTLEERNEVQRAAGRFFEPKHIIVTEERRHNDKLKAGDTRRKYCLDVNRLSKFDAADYWVKLWGVEQGLIIGDGGNDEHMLREVPDLMAVITGTGRAELLNCIDLATLARSGNGEGRRRFREIRSGDSSKYAYVETDKARQAVHSVYRASGKAIWQLMRQIRRQEGQEGNLNVVSELAFWKGLYDQIRNGDPIVQKMQRN